MMSYAEKQIFIVSCIYRIINFCIVQTSFVPDEYWQSIEPAHRLVFGYGHLSWEWDQGLRSYLYPMVFAFIYKVLDIFRMDSRFLIVNLPRLAQCLLASIADVYLFKFASKLYGEGAGLWTVICYWLNWFVFFCSPRTLANTVEAELTIIALYYYPWPSNYVVGRGGRKSPEKPWIYLTIISIATIIRPTSAVFWLPLCFWHLVRMPNPVMFILKVVLPATFPVLMLSIAIDRYCYGKTVVSLWRFLEFNVLQGGSAHFGTHPWHWYFTNCLPTICFTHIILVAYGLWKTKDWLIVGLCSFYILIHSILAHKELRFLLPLLAPLFTYAGRHLDTVFERETLVRKQKYFSIETYLKWTPKRVGAMVAFLFVTNVPLMIYTGLFHQRGVLDVVEFLHEDSHSISTRNVSIWFLTPCYTSPGYSHLHSPVQLRMLDCTPNLENDPDYVEEADRFHADPKSWIIDEFEFVQEHLRPSHIVMYDWMWAKEVGRYLESNGYRRCGWFYNTDFPQSERQSKYLAVLCKR